jgi:hemin uptake protein HemP
MPDKPGSPPCRRQGKDRPRPDSNGHRLVRFRDLSRDTNEVLIEHDGQIYRLLLTRNGKLLLNK